MTTLASATLDVARIVTDVVEGVATGGSSVSLTDASFPRYQTIGSTNLAPSEDTYNGGTIWFNSGANSGYSAIITNSSQSASIGQVFTFAVQSSNCAAADRYAVSDREYPRDLLRQSVNVAISECGAVDQRYENASYVTVADQMTYDLPAGVYNVKAVHIATSTASPYYFVPWNNWREIGDDIRFDEFTMPGVAGYRIALYYNVHSAELTSDTGTVSNYIDTNWLKWNGAVHALRWKMIQTGGDDPTARDRLNEALVKAETKASQYRPLLGEMQQDIHLGGYFTAGPDTTYVSEVGTVRLT